MSELFEIQPCESPRLKWLKKHRVIIEKTSHKVGDEDEFGSECFPFYAVVLAPNGTLSINDLDQWHGGNTEYEALANLAKSKGWLLWNEESLTQPTKGS
jgi:hypothetical protein